MNDKRSALRGSIVSDTEDITLFLSIELPFWIPIESGEYLMKEGKQLKLRNDFWLVSVGNIIDNPGDGLVDSIVNETQVTDHEYLERITGNAARYYHKRKLKTTFTRSFKIIPAEGILTAQKGTESWWQQLNQVVFKLVPLEKHQEFLSDINSFIDHYCALISTSNPSREVRRVSFYETMVRVFINAIIDGAYYSYRTRLAPDLQMAEVPFPHHRVHRRGASDSFRETVSVLDPPVFHQLQWNRTLNHIREKRHQEALLSAAITLETLAHQYLSAKERSKNEIRKAKGLASWIRNLNPPGLLGECENVVDLWGLRNDVVHEQRELSGEDIERIRKGVRSLAKLRLYFLETINPDLLKLENKFSSFLEPIPIGTLSTVPVGRQVPISIEWRSERDHYRTTGVARDNLQDIVNFLDLETEGVKIVAKESSSMKKGAAGFYDFLKNEIWMLREVIPYWFATFVTMRHESRHHQQRLRMISSLVVGGIGSMLSWLYGILAGNYLFIHGVPILLWTAIVCFFMRFEKDARRYEIEQLPDICVILAMMELTLVSHSLGLSKTTKHNLNRLLEEMEVRTPHLLG